MNGQRLVFLLRVFWILIFLNEMFGYVALCLYGLCIVTVCKHFTDSL